MFSIIITEKGGSERRETYDRAEINVGRVQGNDLMLPKGNVSKRHARLLFRDGRFIVTDLKSTNGTYVNGRKIAQATIVREGDKIYIGDFVLRIEMQGGAGAQSGAGNHVEPGMPSSAEASDHGVQVGGPRQGSLPSIDAGASSGRLSAPGVSPHASPPSALPGSGLPGSGPVPSGPSSSVPSAPGALGAPGSGVGSSVLPSSAVPGAVASAAAGSNPAITAAPPPGSGPDGVSYFPLDRDPDEGGYASVPSPPRVPGVPMRAPVAPPVRPQGTQLGTGAAPPMLAAAGGAPQAGTSTAPPGDVATAAPGAIASSPATTTPAPPAIGAPVAAPGGVAPPGPVPATPPALQGAPGAGPASGAAGSAPGPVPSAVPPPNAAAFPPVPPSAQRRTPSSEDRPATVDAARAAVRRQLVGAIVDRVAGAVDLRPLDGGQPAAAALASSIERALRDAAAAAGQGVAPADLEQATADARRELLELGPVGPLLDDEDVGEVQIVRHDHVIASSGRRRVASELAFSSEASLARVLARLCARSDRPLDPGEKYVDRRLDGLRLFAVVGRQGGAGTMITLRRPQRADQTLDDLVRAGAVSRVVASFLGQAVAARANVLVTGAHGSGAVTLLGALAAAGSTDDRVVVLQEDDEIVFNQPHTVSILLGDTAEDGARAVRAALRAHPDRLVLGAFAGHVVTEVLDAVGDGIEGVMAAARAPTLRHLAARLPADVAATRGGIPLDVAREWLASSFDLVVEVAKLRDGRVRVLRVGELVHEGGPLLVKDVFSFVVERIATGGAVEGSFVATGHVPRLAEDLAQRGAPVDPALFKPTSKGGAPR